MNTKHTTFILAMLGALGTAAVVWQRVSVAQANRQLQAVPADSNASTIGADAAMEQEAAALRVQTRDLAKLRNEVSQLRTRPSELAAARTENARLIEAKQTGAPLPREVPPGFISKEQLRNAGYESPEDALQTLFWAMREGSYQLAMQLFASGNRERVHFESLTPEKRAQDEEGFRQRASQQLMKNFNDFSVAQREQISEDAVILHVRSSVGTNTLKFELKRFGNEWKLVDF